MARKKVKSERKTRQYYHYPTRDKTFVEMTNVGTYALSKGREHIPARPISSEGLADVMTITGYDGLRRVVDRNTARAYLSYNNRKRGLANITRRKILFPEEIKKTTGKKGKTMALSERSMVMTLRESFGGRG